MVERSWETATIVTQGKNVVVINIVEVVDDDVVVDDVVV
jgi:hypothetical protein